MTKRQFNEFGLSQGEDERIAYYWDMPSGTNATNVVVTVKDMNSGVPVDVTVAKTSGVASVVGDRLTTPLIILLEPAHTYRIEIAFDTNGNTLEPWFMVAGEV